MAGAEGCVVRRLWDTHTLVISPAAVTGKLRSPFHREVISQAQKLAVLRLCHCRGCGHHPVLVSLYEHTEKKSVAPSGPIATKFQSERAEVGTAR